MAEIYEHGQVVVPKRFREMFGLAPKTQVNFTAENGRLVLESEHDFMKEFEALTSAGRHSQKETERLISETEKKRQKEWLNVP